MGKYFREFRHFVALFGLIGLMPPWAESAAEADSGWAPLRITDTILTLPEKVVTAIPPKRPLAEPGKKLGKEEIGRGHGLYMRDAIKTNLPGVNMMSRTVGAGQQFNIRGYGNGARDNSRGTKGPNSNFDGQGYKVYVNGFPVTDAEGVTIMDDIDFGAVGGVEVVKGPAGSLYGMAISGAVNLTMAPPTRGTTLSQDVLAGSDGLYRTTTRLGSGGEYSSLWVSYGKQGYDGFMKHTASEKDYINAMGEFKLGDRRTAQLFFGQSESDDQRNGEVSIGKYDSLLYNSTRFEANPGYVKNDAHSHITAYRAGLAHTLRFNDQVSHSISVFGSGLGIDVSAGSGWTDKRPLNYGIRTSLDLNFDLGSNLKLTGTVGGEGQRQNAQWIDYPMVVDSSNPSGYNILGAARINQAYVSNATHVFTQWTLEMPYAVSLTAGLGASTEGLELEDHFFVAGNNRPVRTIPVSYEAWYEDMYAPYARVSKGFGGASVYASYSRGYKAPVSAYFFIPTTGTLNTGLKPEVGDQFEIGSNGSLFDGRLDYQIDAFRLIFSDKMTAVAVPLNVPTTATAYSYITNGGSQNHLGVEAVVKGIAYRSKSGAVRSLRPFGNLAYAHFRYEDFRFETLRNKAASPANTLDSVTVRDYSGKAVAGTPEFTANAGLDFDLLYGLYGNVVYSYRGETPFAYPQNFPDSVDVAKSYQIVNAKFGIRRIFGRIEVNAYGGADNLTGAQYYNMLFANQLPDAYIPAKPEMTWYTGFGAQYRF